MLLRARPTGKPAMQSMMKDLRMKFMAALKKMKDLRLVLKTKDVK